MLSLINESTIYFLLFFFFGTHSLVITPLQSYIYNRYCLPHFLFFLKKNTLSSCELEFDTWKNNSSKIQKKTLTHVTLLLARI